MDITLLQLEKEDIILLTKGIGGLASLIILVPRWYIHNVSKSMISRGKLSNWYIRPPMIAHIRLLEVLLPTNSKD